jgi:uncharacterized delta-60 repeat protein
VAFQFAVPSAVYGPFTVDRAIDEADGVARIPILRRGYLDSEITATVITPGSTATAGQDFQPGLSVRFAAGEKRGVLEVPIVDDCIAEPDKYLNLVFDEPVPAGVFRGLSRNRLWILDNDRAGSLRDGFRFAGYAPSLAASREGADGKFYASVFGSGLTSAPVNMVARFNGDGSLDWQFQPYPLPDSAGAVPTQVTLLDDGDRVLVNLGDRLVRLGPTGTPDADFHVTVAGETNSAPSINEVLVQRDGRKRGQKIIIVGRFTKVNGVARKNVARLRPNAEIDPGFDPGAGPDDVVLHAALTPDHRLVIAGSFQHVNGQPRALLARLRRDGSLDPGLDPGAGFTDPFGGVPVLSSLAAQQDGKILVGGNFDTYQGEPHTALVRILSNGASDTNFNLGTGLVLDPTAPSDYPAFVEGIKLLRDGKMLVSGGFAQLNGTPATGIVRLNRDGALDATFRLRGTDAILSRNFFNNSYDPFYVAAPIALLPGGDILCVLDSQTFFIQDTFGPPLLYSGNVVRLRGVPARCKEDEKSKKTKESEKRKSEKER